MAKVWWHVAAMFTLLAGSVAFIALMITQFPVWYMGGVPRVLAGATAVALSWTAGGFVKHINPFGMYTGYLADNHPERPHQA
jgi:hypothetical protein